MLSQNGPPGPTLRMAVVGEEICSRCCCEYLAAGNCDSILII